MTANTNRIHYLFEQYMQKACTREELQELFAFIAQPEYRPLLEQLMDAEYEVLQPLAAAQEIDWEYIYQQVIETANDNVIPLDNKRRFRWTRIAVAATVIIAIGTAGYWLMNRFSKNNIARQEQSVQQSKDVLPGGNKAMLTLADGSTIILDSAQNGMLSEQGSAKVIKNKNGEVEYQPAISNQQLTTDQTQSRTAYNMLATPKGGQYQLVLPDGSKVWLNAASSIRYPVSFTGNERRVELTGEAYFEVAHLQLPSGQKMPFKVSILSSAGGSESTHRGEVEVLGTHFNINAYNDEPSVNTTLLEGRVKVKSEVGSQKSDQASDFGPSVVLNPGQQAIFSSSPAAAENRQKGIKVIDDADLELAMAWKNGFIAFKSADIKSVMRQIARWYNVEVVYEGAVPQRTFTGGISRNVNLSKLLHLLEVSKVHFRIEGNKLVVMP